MPFLLLVLEALCPVIVYLPVLNLLRVWASTFGDKRVTYLTVTPAELF